MSQKGYITFLPPEYAVFDLETTGLNTKTCEILEIGALKIRNGVVVDKFETFVHPEGGLSKSAMKVNHITYDMVKDADSVSVCIRAFLNFVGSATLIGYNCNAFDLPIVRRVAGEEGLDFQNNSIDLLPIARRTLELPNHKLTSIADYYEIDTSNAHRAIDDCLITFECCKHLVEESDNFCKSSSAGISENEVVTILGKSLSFTGDFRGDKDKLEQRVIEAGGAVKDKVSSRTAYVVIGEIGSPKWSRGNYGAKVKKAMELQAAGGKVKIVTEQQLMEALK